jgi:hypothetical protein
MIQVRDNSLEDQDVWIKTVFQLESKGDWTERYGIVTVTYIPGRSLITSIECGNPEGVALEEVASRILEEIKTSAKPKYVEIALQLRNGSSIFINYGPQDYGMDQVANFRFSEPQFS